VSEGLSEEQLRQLEAEMERITVDDVLVQTVVTLLNLGARKAGLGAAPGAPAPTPEWDEVRQAIEGARALMPLLERRHAAELGPVRDTLARLQMIYAQSAGGGGGDAPPQEHQPPAQEQPPAQAQAPPPPEPAEEGPGPAQRSGRLWVPGD
jgi:hypothetical protein